MITRLHKDTIDVMMVVLFNLYNILLIVMFYGRVNPKWRLGGVPGAVSLFVGLPLFALAMINLLQRCEWWTYTLPLILIGFIIIEILLDYVFKIDFRQTWLVGPYLLVFFVSNMLMVGYALLVNQVWGFATLLIYFCMTGISIYARMKTGL